MDKENLIEFTGNILLGVFAPYLFLISGNPIKFLFNNGVKGDNKDGNSK